MVRGENDPMQQDWSKHKFVDPHLIKEKLTIVVYLSLARGLNSWTT